mgnify:CR=1 FL=1
MMLNKKTYASAASENVDALFALPEKVLQFGTGVLLRGLPDYFIDKANKDIGDKVFLDMERLVNLGDEKNGKIILLI